ncbi:MAG: purine/pyrimidine permease [Rickettsiales bacterium]|jgi:uracil permease|nr:purine/pyrimidine permease [Rickettsiales bacterium]
MSHSVFKKDISYSIQVLLVSISSLVLAPKLVGLNVSLSLFAAGMATLIYHLLTNNKIPIFLGPSLYFIMSGKYIIDRYGISSFFGAMLTCSVIYVLFALFFPKDKEKLEKYFPVCIITTILLLIGLSLSNISLKSMLSFRSNGIFNHRSFTVSIITVITMIYFSYFSKPKTRPFSILIAVFVGTLFSIFFNLIDFSILKEASWVVIPWTEAVSENKYKLPTFSLNAVLILLPVYVLVAMEHISTLYALSKARNSDYFFGEYGIKRSYIGMFGANVIASLFGTTPVVMYIEVVNVMDTDNYTPVVLSVAGILLIFISMFGKIVALLSLIPDPVIASIAFVLFMRMSVFGIKYLLLDSKVEYLKNLLLVVLILFINIGGMHFTTLKGGIMINSLSLSLLLSLILNFILINTKICKIILK